MGDCERRHRTGMAVKHILILYGGEESLKSIKKKKIKIKKKKNFIFRK